MTTTIQPAEIRFIKLGRKGEWERSCIEEDAVIRLGYLSPLHNESLRGNWEDVSKHWCQVREGNSTTAANDVRQIRDFYQQPKTTLWITFYNRMLWWCFADLPAELLQDGSRVRHVIGQWSNKDLCGRPLTIQSLDGRLTKIVGYRGTICELDREIGAYLVRKINGNHPPEVLQAQKALDELQASVEKLIKGLWWKDFELLVDLIFAKSGWQRVSVLGQTEKAIDLDLEAPVTGRRAFVQVKSQASTAALEESIAEFQNMAQYDEFYFVVHTAEKLAQYNSSDPRVQVIGSSRLAQLVVGAGLVSWLINKRS